MIQRIGIVAVCLGATLVGLLPPDAAILCNVIWVTIGADV